MNFNEFKKIRGDFQESNFAWRSKFHEEVMKTSLILNYFKVAGE